MKNHETIRESALSLAREVDEAPKLDVFVLHWNSPLTLLETVGSLRSSKGVYVSLTVLDNDSDPSMRDVIASSLPEDVPLVRLERNLGYTGGMNHALASWLRNSSRHEFCVVTAHDVVAGQDTLRRLLEAAETHRAFGILAPVVEYQGEQTGRSLGGEWRRMRGAQDRVSRGPMAMPPSGPSVLEADWVCGACLLLRRQCLDEAGLFDSELFAYYEDVDLCLRARSFGWKVGIATSGLVRLRTTALNSAGSAYLGVRNQLFLANRYGGRWGSVAATARLIGRMIRPCIGSLAPRRSPGRRRESRAFLKALAVGGLDYFAGRMEEGSLRRLQSDPSAPEKTSR